MKLISIIVPVYNRPQEIKELLESISTQISNQVEIIVIEDGSTILCKAECAPEIEKGYLKYFFQENQGPGSARNHGAKEASGSYLLFLDSDCLIPEDFLLKLINYLQNNTLDCWGGPDAAHVSFSPIQKAINYSMTSTLTTGGIRGSKKAVDTFYPRSFNMGIRKEVFEKVNGFSRLRFGEDLDLSMRILEAGYKTQLLEDHFVYHKRRNNFRSFFKQVFNSGKARINLNLRHPGSLKLVHALPSLFAMGNIFGLLLAILYPPLLLVLMLPALAFFTHAWVETKSVNVALLAVVASYFQLFGYGLGFMNAYFFRIILKKEESYSFIKTFYK